MTKHLPNSITLLNLLSGCIALVLAFDGRLQSASMFILAGAFFDFIDGFAARILRAKSPIGKELDSLADVVTFGVAPGVLIYVLMKQDVSVPGLYIGAYSILPFLGFILPLFSALRLAKFNVDDRQSAVFYGLPTPASALFFASIPLILVQETFVAGLSAHTVHTFVTNFYVLAALTVLVSFLMVSEIQLFSLKFNTFSWSHNRVRYGFLVVSIALFAAMRMLAVPLILFLYVLTSLIFRRTDKS